MGKAKNLRKRVSSYFLNKDLGDKTKLLVSRINKIKTISVKSEIEAFLLEERLVKKHQPKYNISLKDGKTYPLIEIPIKEKYPPVLFVRKRENKNSLYFGPYTSVFNLRLVLKILRRIFPYQSVRNHDKKLCLYYHLNLCPCPNAANDKTYKKNIKHIINFLNGKTQKVINDLEKEREEESEKENFETAEAVQKKIEAINLITSPFYKPFEYEQNPNLKSDLTQIELNSLINILNENGEKVKKLERIECYDISNTAGKNATASMVVMINGNIDNSFYRRFRIKGFYNDKPNDFAMLSEVLRRRFNHKDWPIPSLIIIDGGKGQVSTALKVLNGLNLQIPLIGLAKREETIITSRLSEIKLDRNNKALLLIMRLRDEAHRFAVSYHRKLRKKAIFG